MTGFRLNDLVDRWLARPAHQDQPGRGVLVVSSGGLGDIRLGGKFTVVRRGGTAVALLAKIGIPTSTVADYGGDTWATFSPGSSGFRVARIKG